MFGWFKDASVNASRSNRASLAGSLVNVVGRILIATSRCSLSSRADVVAAGPHRLLQVLVVPRKAPGCQLIESIGHELYHAVEVLREPAVRSFQQLYSLFQRLGAASSGRFETNEAVSAGLAVSREAC